jgi:hypothetical protein
VNATVGTDRVNERCAVGAAQFLDLAIAQDQRDDGVLAPAIASRLPASVE